MSRQVFQGTVNVDIRDSKPDWAPFEPAKAPDGAPSVVHIVLDDVGNLCPDDEMNLASTRRNWPCGRGFERWYGFLGAETNQWYPDLVYDNHLVDQPSTPEEGYHLTVDLTDKAIGCMLDRDDAIARAEAARS